MWLGSDFSDLEEKWGGGVEFSFVFVEFEVFRG